MRTPPLVLTLVLAGCSSEIHQAAQGAAVDSGSTGGAPGSSKDSSANRDAAHPTPGDARSPTDVASEADICGPIAGPSPDFSILITGDLAYDGPIAVEAA